MPWIDTHCHLDAAEFDADRDAVRQQAQLLGVDVCVIPAVMASHFDEVRLLAHRHADAYALGIHPLYTPQASDSDLTSLDTHLHAHRDDPRLVAVGEIGLDGFVPDINTPEALAKQTHFLKPNCNLRKNTNCPSSCTCGVAQTDCSRDCENSQWSAASPMLSMAACNKRRCSSRWVSSLVLAAR